MKVYKDKEFRELRPVLVHTVCDFCGKEFKKSGNTVKLDVVNLKQERDIEDMAYDSGYDRYQGWSFDICHKCLSEHERKTVYVEDKSIMLRHQGLRR